MKEIKRWRRLGRTGGVGGGGDEGGSGGVGGGGGVKHDERIRDDGHWTSQLRTAAAVIRRPEMGKQGFWGRPVDSSMIAGLIDSLAEPILIKHKDGATDTRRRGIQKKIIESESKTRTHGTDRSETLIGSVFRLQSLKISTHTHTHTQNKDEAKRSLSFLWDAVK